MTEAHITALHNLVKQCAAKLNSSALKLLLSPLSHTVRRDIYTKDSDGARRYSPLLQSTRAIAPEFNFATHCFRQERRRKQRKKIKNMASPLFGKIARVCCNGGE